MIDLDIIIVALETSNDETTMFYDRQLADTLLLSEYMDDFEELAEAIDADVEHRYLRLPDRREINEYGMMKDFIETLSEGVEKETLAMAISGRGAFRRFKDTLYRFDLEARWYAFRYAACARVARNWCEENDIEYREKD